jgi:iron complex outermembrane receptor protein
VRRGTDPFGRTAGYVNGSGGFSRGVELGLEAHPASALRLATSYTFTDARTDRDVTVPGFHKATAVFRHTATLMASYRPTGRIDATVDVFRGSEMFGSFFAAGRARAYRYPGFTKVALVAGYRLTGAARPLRAYVKIDNILDETYYEAGWRALGRTILGGLSFSR